MWNLTVPTWELVIRGIVVYGFLLGLLRLTGKRQIGQLAPFDLVLLLVLSNSVQNSMNAGDNSLIGGLISALTLMILNYIVGWVTFKSKKLSRLVEGQPEVLVHNGVIYENVLDREKLTRHELETAMRQAGCVSYKDVHFAILENNGSITVKKRD